MSPLLSRYPCELDGASNFSSFAFPVEVQVSCIRCKVISAFGIGADPRRSPHNQACLWGHRVEWVSCDRVSRKGLQKSAVFEVCVHMHHPDSENVLSPGSF